MTTANTDALLEGLFNCGSNEKGTPSLRTMPERLLASLFPRYERRVRSCRRLRKRRQNWPWSLRCFALVAARRRWGKGHVAA